MAFQNGKLGNLGLATKDYLNTSSLFSPPNPSFFKKVVRECRANIKAGIFKKMKVNGDG